MSRDLTILVVHWGRSGGGPLFSYNIAHALAQLPQIRVLASFNSESEIADRWQEFDLHHPVTTYHTTAGALLAFPRAVGQALRLRRMSRVAGVDVVYSPMVHLWSSAVARIIAGPAFLLESVHDATPHPGDGSVALASVQRWSIRRADAVAVYSDAVADQLVARATVPSRKIVRLRHGVDTRTAEARELRRLGPGDEYKVVLVGRLKKYKGIEVFVEAIEILRRSGVRVTGVVHGSGNLRGLAVPQTSGTVLNIGWLSEEEFEGLVGQADLLCLPYQEASQSGPLTWSASLGVPAVVTPVGGLAEQAARLGNAVVAQGTDAVAVAEAIAKLLADEGAYRECSRKGLEAAQGDDSWDAVARELTDELARRTSIGSK